MWLDMSICARINHLWGYKPPETVRWLIKAAMETSVGAFGAHISSLGGINHMQLFHDSDKQQCAFRWAPSAPTQTVLRRYKSRETLKRHPTSTLPRDLLTCRAESCTARVMHWKDQKGGTVAPSAPRSPPFLVPFDASHRTYTTLDTCLVPSAEPSEHLEHA